MTDDVKAERDAIAAFAVRVLVVEQGGDAWAEGWNAAMRFVKLAIERGDHLQEKNSG